MPDRRARGQGRRLPRRRGRSGSCSGCRGRRDGDLRRHRRRARRRHRRALLRSGRGFGRHGPGGGRPARRPGAGRGRCRSDRPDGHRRLHLARGGRGAAAGRLRSQGQGRIVVLSSVAGVRVRRANFLYGASKAGLDAFTRGLAEATRGSGVRVQVVRPGFVRTKMTVGLRPAPFAASPEDVARGGPARVRDEPSRHLGAADAPMGLPRASATCPSLCGDGSRDETRLTQDRRRAAPPRGDTAGRDFWHCYGVVTGASIVT